MPHAITPLQRNYLEFLRSYIRENESSPRLEEIADHFGVKPPTAHKTLEALHDKGYIYFARDSRKNRSMSHTVAGRKGAGKSNSSVILPPSTTWRRQGR